MPRIIDQEIRDYLQVLSQDGDEDFRSFLLRCALCDLQDARAALRAILNWKNRPTYEPPLTYIERVAREVVG